MNFIASAFSKMVGFVLNVSCNKIENPSLRDSIVVGKCFLSTIGPWIDKIESYHRTSFPDTCKMVIFSLFHQMFFLDNE